MLVGRRIVIHSWAGRIPETDSRIFALAEWANGNERKLLGLHCGQTLDRYRHLKWAKEMLA